MAAPPSQQRLSIDPETLQRVSGTNRSMRRLISNSLTEAPPETSVLSKIEQKSRVRRSYSSDDPSKEIKAIPKPSRLMRRASSMGKNEEKIQSMHGRRSSSSKSIGSKLSSSSSGDHHHDSVNEKRRSKSSHDQKASRSKSRGESTKRISSSRGSKKSSSDKARSASRSPKERSVSRSRESAKKGLEEAVKRSSRDRSESVNRSSVSKSSHQSRYSSGNRSPLENKKPTRNQSSDAPRNSQRRSETKRSKSFDDDKPSEFMSRFNTKSLLDHLGPSSNGPAGPKLVRCNSFESALNGGDDGLRRTERSSRKSSMGQGVAADSDKYNFRQSRKSSLGDRGSDKDNNNIQKHSMDRENSTRQIRKASMGRENSSQQSRKPSMNQGVSDRDNSNVRQSRKASMGNALNDNTKKQPSLGSHLAPTSDKTTNLRAKMVRSNSHASALGDKDVDPETLRGGARTRRTTALDAKQSFLGNHLGGASQGNRRATLMRSNSCESGLTGINDIDIDEGPGGTRPLSRSSHQKNQTPSLRATKSSTNDTRKSLLDSHVGSSQARGGPKSFNRRATLMRSNSCESALSGVELDTKISKADLLKPMPAAPRRGRGGIDRRQTMALVGAQALTNPELDEKQKNRVADLGNRFKSSALEISKITAKASAVNEKLGQVPSFMPGMPSGKDSKTTSSPAATNNQALPSISKPKEDGITSLMSLGELPAISKTGFDKRQALRKPQEGSFNTLSTASLSVSAKSRKSNATKMNGADSDSAQRVKELGQSYQQKAKLLESKKQ